LKTGVLFFFFFFFTVEEPSPADVPTPVEGEKSPAGGCRGLQGNVNFANNRSKQKQTIKEGESRKQFKIV